MASSPYASTEETTNACRACRLLLGPCTDQLREVLLHHVPLSAFTHTLKQKRGDLPRLAAPQMNLILPTGSNYTGNYDDMDISLLYILLRNVCGISPHNKGWGNNPDPTDISLSANIERIRIARNQCVHSFSVVLSNADFNKVWSSVKSAVVDIDSFLNNGKKYEKEVDFLRHETMDPVHDSHYIEKLRKQAEEDAETRELVQGLKIKIEESDIQRTENHNEILQIVDEIMTPKSVIPPNVKDIYEKEIIRWKEEDVFYSETHSFRAMLDKVRKQPFMTFVGVPGSGKSATIHHIALIVQKEGYEIVPIIDIRKIEDYSDSRHPQVFVIDDVVGVHGLQKQKLELLIDYEERISDPFSKNTKVLLSCREAVFNECYKSFFLNEKNIIRMESSENALNDEDKKAILQKYSLHRDLLSLPLLRNTSGMFPLLCKIYSKGGEEMKKNVGRFFTCHVECILDEIDKMQHQNNLCYATLVLCMLNDNKLSKATLKNIGNTFFCEMKSQVLESCEVETYTDAFRFVKALSVMEGTYTKLCGSEYTFIHDYMFEVLAYHFGCQFPELVLQYISSSYIVNKMKVQEGKKQLVSESKQVSENEEFSGEEHEVARNELSQDSFNLCIRVTEDHFPMLAERLYRDIENMELYDVFMNNNLKHPKVCQAFIEVLKTKSYTELKSLFLSEQKDVSKIVSKGESLTEESEEKDKTGRERFRQRVLIRQRRVVNESGLVLTHHCVRVISWVVYYGHSQILQYIVKQTDLHKETENELFWNFFIPKFSYETREIDNNIEKNQEQGNSSCVSEQNRLLVLGCYSGDLETVRIFMKYVDVKTINRELQFDSFLFGTPMKAACEGGHISIVKEFLKAGADINSQGEYRTPLTAACSSGHMSVVKVLLDARADINPQGKYCSPLIAACRGGHMSVVKELLKRGADINPQNAYDTPLRASCEGGHIIIVKVLLKAGANINQQGKYDTPLIAACNGGHMSIIRELLKAGANINQLGKNGTPMTAACRGGHMAVVKELIKAGADINPKGKCDTPLIASCSGGHLSIVKELLETGADINPRGGYTTPLTAACKGGHISVVKELLGWGPDINSQGEYDTPLRAACEGGHMSIVKELLKAGADINLQGNYDTPLTSACSQGHMSIVNELLEAGADINLRCQYQTPLSVPYMGGLMSVLKQLLEAGSDINQQGKYKTPLTAACIAGHMSVVKQLLKAGADINPQDKLNTPLTAACSGGHLSIVKELLEAGADINPQGKYTTPLTAACKGGHMSVVKELLGMGAFDNPQYKYTVPLLQACSGGHKSIVMELIQVGADINPQGQYSTPLIEACRGGHMRVVKELIGAGAYVNALGRDTTPLIAACRGGHMIVVKELLGAGAEINLNWYDTPLIAAYKGGHMSVVKELIKAGADISKQGMIHH